MNKTLKIDYSIVLTTKHLNEMVEVLKSDLIAFDVITTNMTPIDAEIVNSLSFSVNEKTLNYVPI